MRLLCRGICKKGKVWAAVLVICAAGCKQRESPAVERPLPPEKRIEATKFDALYRSFKELQGALSVGVTQPQLLPLLQKIGTELSILGDRVKSDAERDLARRYADVLSEYQDSDYVWQKGIEAGSRYQNQALVTFEFIGMRQTREDDPRLAEIAKKYNLQLEKHEEFGRRWTSIPSTGVRSIWSDAGEKLQVANQTYLRSRELGS